MNAQKTANFSFVRPGVSAGLAVSGKTLPPCGGSDDTHLGGASSLSSVWDGILNRPVQAGEKYRISDEHGTQGTKLWRLLYNLVFNNFFWKCHVTDGHPSQLLGLLRAGLQYSSRLHPGQVTLRGHFNLDPKSSFRLWVENHFRTWWATPRMTETFHNCLNRGNMAPDDFFKLRQCFLKIIHQKILEQW